MITNHDMTTIPFTNDCLLLTILTRMTGLVTQLNRKSKYYVNISYRLLLAYFRVGVAYTVRMQLAN